MTTNEQEMVLEYIFGSENVELALKILDAGEAIRNRIIRAFVKSLKSELQKRLTAEWQVGDNLEEEKSVTRQSWVSVYVTRKSWRDWYQVGIWADRRGPGAFHFAIRHEWERMKNCEKIGSERAKELGRGIRKSVAKDTVASRESDWCPVWYWSEEYTDWDDMTTLWDLHSNGGEQARAFFVEKLVQLAEASESAIDDAVRQITPP